MVITTPVYLYSSLDCKADDRNVLNVSEEINFLLSNTTPLSQQLNNSNRKKFLAMLCTTPAIAFSLVHKQLRQAEDVIIKQASRVDVCTIRQGVLDFFIVLRCLKDDQKIQQLVQSLEMSLLNATYLKDGSLSKFISDQSLLVSTYLHMYLDVKWLLFTINNSVEHLITQLAYISLKRLQMNKSLFPCKCFETTWLRLQIYCEMKNVDFWIAFNTALACYDEKFTIIFIEKVAELQCYNANGEHEKSRVVQNYEFLLQKWHTFIENDPNDKDLHECLLSIENLMANLWTEHVTLEFFHLTWDYFYRKINSFELKGDLIELSAEKKTPFQLFLHILYNHLEKTPAHWNKFKGRIYTRFWKPKIPTLTRVSLCNLSLMYTLLLPVSFDEITERMMEILNNFPNNKQNAEFLWKLSITLIRLHIKHERRIEVPSKALLQLLDSTTKNRTDLHLVTTFTQQMQQIFTENCRLQQNLLFDKWLHPYMKHCKSNELDTFLNSLLNITEHIVEDVAWYEYQQAYVTHILPALKDLSTSSSSDVIGKLAAVIVINSESVLKITIQEFSKPDVDKSVMVAFFSTVAQRLIHTNVDSDILKAWVQCTLVQECDLHFTQLVFNLDEVKYMDLPLGGDPLENFIKAMGGGKHKHIVRSCFSLKEWIDRHLVQEKFVLRVYKYMSLVFEHCGDLLYQRAPLPSSLNGLIDILLLPLDVLRWRKPSDCVMKAMEQYFASFAMSIYKMSEDDTYLTRVLRDLVTRYVPLLQSPVGRTQLFKIAEDERLLELVFTKIKTYFLLQTAKVEDEKVFQIIRVVTDFIRFSTDDDITKLAIAHTLTALLETYMFKNLKSAVVDCLKHIKLSQCYCRGAVKETIIQSMEEMLKKHLMFTTEPFYQMSYTLAKIFPKELDEMMPRIREEMIAVERKRNHGFDKSLRQGFEKLRVLCK